MPNNLVQGLISSATIPDMKILANKSFKELSSMRIKQLQWTKDLSALGFTLDNGQSVKAGTEDFN